MKLEGIHHITAITSDAPGNVRFYAGTLGLRLVKKSVNQDDPTVYHLFYADEEASAGSDITFFEYPGVPRGRAGAGMVHRVIWRVPSEDSLGFWTDRLNGVGVESRRTDDSLLFSDPEGLDHELVVDRSGDPPLKADGHPEIPAEHALQGFDGVRAYASEPEDSTALLEDTLGFQGLQGLQSRAWSVRGDRRGSFYVYDPPPEQRPLQGGGSVHHVAWATAMGSEGDWRSRVAAAGARPTPVIDRFYFRSVYFREPSGVLFEIATLGPGFTVDEPLAELGQKLSLPPDYEHLRPKVESILKPLPDPRAEAAVQT